MRIQTKLLIILLTISVIPLTLLGVIRIRNSLELGRDLTARQGTALIEQARRLMSVIADDHARTLHRERQLLEATLKYQALAARTRLLGPVPVDPDPVLFDSELDQMKESLRLRKLRSRCAWLGLPAAKEDKVECVDKQIFQLAPGLSPKTAQDDVARLANMDDVYRDLTEGNRDLIAWQAVGLENGLFSIYPGHGQFPPGYDARQSAWYVKAKGSDGVVWIPPQLHETSGEVLLTAALAIRDGKGKFLGAGSVMAPLNIFLQQNEHTRHLSSNIDAMFLRLEKSEDGASVRWRILAQRQPASHVHDDAQSKEAERHESTASRWLVLDTPDAREYFIAQTQKGEGGIFQAPHRGILSLWVFAPVPGDEDVLVFTAPIEDVLRDAKEAMDQVAIRMRAQIIQAVFILGLTIMMVVFLSLVIAKRVTVPLRYLAHAARKLSLGDYKTTVEISGRDELSELGKVFNEMGPRIEENLLFREGAMLAMQVQQNLLPNSPPKIPGLDVAGTSIYCDDTGGDYFDFFLRQEAGAGVLAVSIGDVSGHGMEAALLMTTARAFLRMRAHLSGRPSEVISDVNRFLSMDTEGTGRFMSLFYLEIELQRRTLTWVRAGHDAALLYDPDRNEFTELGGPGLTLGVAQDWDFVESAPKHFGNGEIVVLGSDGIWEACDPHGRMFGKARLKEIVQQTALGSARDMVDAVLEALDRFREGAKPDDDVTLVIVKNEWEEGS